MLPAHNSVDNRAQTHRCLQKSTMTAAGTNTTVTTAALPSRPRRLSHHCFFPRALAYAHVDAAREHGGEETRQPLLSPDESVYLEMNLRLMLERSQVALLRRNQLMFESSLGSAAEWMETYFDPNDDGVVRSRESIEALLATQLELPLPDISGSLRALQKISRGQEN